MKGETYEVGDTVRVLSKDEIIQETGMQPKRSGAILDFIPAMYEFCNQHLTVTSIGSNQYGRYLRVQETGYVFYDWCTENISKPTKYDKNLEGWQSIMEGI